MLRLLLRNGKTFYWIKHFTTQLRVPSDNICNFLRKTTTHTFKFNSVESFFSLDRDVIQVALLLLSI